MVRRMDASELVDGMVLAEDVCTAFGAKIASNGEIINKTIISMFKANRIHNVKVIISENEQPRSIADNIRILEGAMRFCRNKTIFANEREVVELTENVIKIILDMPNSYEYIDLLMELKNHSETVFAHSVNVAFICYKFANWHRMSMDQLRELTIAALIHDIGKIQIPVEILDAREPLSEGDFTKIKKHSINGYMMLKSSDIPEIIKRPIIDHHERCDGSGYPMGYKFQQISEYGRIIGIVDSYEAMTSKRMYRDKICPFKIASIMLKEAEGEFDTVLAEEFFYNILETYIGSKVKLSNGYTARLKAINKQDISHPVVELAGQSIDLSMDQFKKSNIQVVGIVFE